MNRIKKLEGKKKEIHIYRHFKKNLASTQIKGKI